MAITIFLALNGLAVAFLLYVLVNFWNEGHRFKSEPRGNAFRGDRRDWAQVAVITHPISPAAHGGLAAMAFPAAGRRIRAAQEGSAPAGKVRDFAAKRISTR
jgi:hypothetical protein